MAVRRRVKKLPDHSGAADDKADIPLAPVTEPQKTSTTGDRRSVIIQPDGLLAAAAASVMSSTSHSPPESSAKDDQGQVKSNFTNSRSNGTEGNERKLNSESKSSLTVNSTGEGSSKRLSLVTPSNNNAVSGQSVSNKRRSLLFETVIHEPDASKEVNFLSNLSSSRKLVVTEDLVFIILECPHLKSRCFEKNSKQNRLF